MTALFELTSQLKELEKLRLSDDVPEEVIRDTVESLDGEFDEKAVAVGKLILNLESDAAKISAAAKAMDKRAELLERRAERIRAYLLLQLQFVNKRRIETPELCLRRLTNPPAVVVTDIDAVPRQYFLQPETPPPRLDKIALKRALGALKEGEVIPGCHAESGERVEIGL